MTRWNLPLVTRHRVADAALVTALERDLDRGEAETIALAIQLGADLVLLEEHDGRRAAQRLGLRVTGVVGVLLAAKQGALLPAIGPQLDRLRRAGFHLSDAVCRHALSLVGED
ncbi:MAG: DUF3368 domain-containing protein [Chloroflexota bacterium]